MLWHLWHYALFHSPVILSYPWFHAARCLSRLSLYNVSWSLRVIYSCFDISTLTLIAFPFQMDAESRFLIFFGRQNNTNLWVRETVESWLNFQHRPTSERIPMAHLPSIEPGHQRHLVARPRRHACTFVASLLLVRQTCRDRLCRLRQKTTMGALFF